MDEVMSLFNDTKNMVAGIFGDIEIAEDEIGKAQERHPEVADMLYHSFTLMTPTSDLLTKNERTYRSHVRELLERVADFKDTRPGTDAEILVGCSEASLRFPLGDATTGLYMRLFSRVFGDKAPEIVGEQAELLERLHGGEIDALERQARKDVNVPDRVLPKVITCEGRHNGDSVDCLYSRPAGGLLPRRDGERRAGRGE